MSTMQPASMTDAINQAAANLFAGSHNKKAIELRQATVTLPCGVTCVRIDLQVSNSNHTYSLGVFAGFVGGGRDEEQALAPRVRVNEFIPKYTHAVSGKLVEAWPPLPALARKVDGRTWEDTHLPEGSTPQRLEKAMAAVEPLLRQLVNQRQQQLGMDKADQVADYMLVARIKHVLENY